MDLPAITIIVPTMASPARRDTLRRALDSVQGQDGVEPHVIVVVNGPDPDPVVCDMLSSDPTLTVLRSPVASVSNARLIGRRAVATPCFGFLDDDDVFLDGALRRGVTALLDDPACDVVVMNGEKDFGSRQIPTIPDIAALRRDPLRELLDVNWMPSLSCIFDTKAIAESYHADLPDFFEQTVLAFRLLVNRKTFKFVDGRNFVIYKSSGGHASGSIPYRRSLPGVLQSLLALDLPSDVKRSLRNKLSAAHHDVAFLELSLGNRAAAWAHHLRSLRSIGSLRYLSSTRHLLWTRGS